MINFIFVSGERDALRPDLGNRRFATLEINHGGKHMSVQRYKEDSGEIVERPDGDYVRYEDFETILFALRTVRAACAKFASRDLNDTTAAATRDYLQKIVDQYE